MDRIRKEMFVFNSMLNDTENQGITREEKEYFEHFPRTISEDIMRYVTNVVMRKSRYIFYENQVGRYRRGHCTHCGNDFVTEENLKHKTKYFYPDCGEYAQLRNAKISRMYITNYGNFVFYKKYAKNKKSDYS